MISHFFTRPRAEARLLRQPSTPAPSAHPKRSVFIVWKQSFLYNKKAPFCLKGGEGGRRALKGGIVYKKEGVRLI